MKKKAYRPCDCWLVSGEAVEEVMNEMFENPDANISQIEWDSFTEGVVTVCITADTPDEAIEIAKRYYGFQKYSVEQC